MPVTVLNHQHDPAIVLDGVGTHGQQLMIQTGTIIFDFRGDPQEGWLRDRLTHPVLQLPPGTDSLLFTPRIRAIASAAPASMHYGPSPAAGTTGGGTGLIAQGPVVLTGSDIGGGAVQVSGTAALPVLGGGPGSATVPIPGAGWAVDRTRATRAGGHIQLEVDLAVAGPSSLLRLAYSLFVTVSPRTISDAALTIQQHQREP